MDAGVEVEECLLKKYNLTGSYILKLGHHRGMASSGKKIIDDINPK